MTQLPSFVFSLNLGSQHCNTASRPYYKNTDSLFAFVHFSFFVFSHKLLRPASFMLHRFSAYFFTFISSFYGGNCASEQTGARTSHPGTRVLCSWCAPVLLTCHHVQVYRGTHYSPTFALEILILANFVKQAYKLAHKSSRFGTNPGTKKRTTATTTFVLPLAAYWDNPVGRACGHYCIELGSDPIGTIYLLLTAAATFLAG